jgi:acid phosphatase
MIFFRARFVLIVFLSLLGIGTAHAEMPIGCERPISAPKLDATNPLNLGQLKYRLIQYRCTRYDSDIAKEIGKARIWITKRATQVPKPALVLDVDETALSNWPVMYHNDFGYVADGDCDLKTRRACGQNAWEESSAATAIAPTLALFGFAKAHHIAVFFITGRHENGGRRAATEANLHNAGYDGWTGLYLRPAESHEPSPTPFKARAREDIEKHGYRVIANIGDQASDLAGGHAERGFKLPNPFYYIP